VTAQGFVFSSPELICTGTLIGTLGKELLRNLGFKANPLDDRFYLSIERFLTRVITTDACANPFDVAFRTICPGWPFDWMIAIANPWNAFR
jgi:hypothetical protein